MKKTVKILGIAAIAAMALVSCQKETLAPVNDIKTVQMTIHGAADAMTKTVLQEDGTVLWGEGEKLGVFETIDETTKYYTSEEGVSADGGKTMSFPVTLTESDAAAFTYNAFYPVSALVGGDTDVTKVRTIFPSTQKPTATSFDAAADFLLAQPKEVTEQAAELKLSFKRVIGIAKMTLKNFPTDANVKEVAFTANTAEGKDAPILAGRIRLNMTAGTAEYGYDSPSNTISLDYAGQTIAADGMTVFFASCPFELGEGDSFQVAVTTDENITYTQKVTLTADQTLAVKPGRASVFSVNMKGAEEEEVADLAGEYIFVGKTSTDWRYMSSNIGSLTYLPVVETGVTLDADKLDLTSSATDFPTVTETWTVEKCGDNYAIKSQGGKYVSYSGSGNSATLTNDPYELKISKLDNGSYDIASVATSGRKLRFNSGSPRFAFYTSAQADVYMIPFVKSTKPMIIVDKDEFEVPAAGGEFAIYPTVMNIDGDITAETKADWIDISYYGSDEVDFEVAANTGATRTATIVLSYEGAQDVIVTVNQMAASGNDGSTPEKAFTASEAYAFVSNLAAGATSTEKYYVKGIISSIKYFFSAEYGTATFNFSDDGETTSTQFIAYSTYYFENKAWVEGNQQIKVGDEVIVYGQVVNYSGNTPEFASKLSNLYSLNGKTSDDEGGDEPTGDLTPVPSQAFTFADLGFENGEVVSSVAGTNCEIDFAKGNGSNDPKYYTSGSAVRAYGGNTITVSAAEGYGLTTIEFTFASGEGSNAITANTGTFTDGKWTGDASEVVFTIGGTTGHRRISSIKIN